MKYAIIGYGKMGHTIEKLLLQKKDNVCIPVDNDTDYINNLEELKQCDVAFEFSTPQTAVENIYKCFDIYLPVVCGTTGWLDRLDEVKKECLATDNTFIYAPNFSVGMNVFMKTADYLSQITADLGSFKVDISETHHIHKKDAPSGTAISLKEIVNKSYHNPDGIPIKSIREGEIIGIHSINFKSPLETITITHSLSSRDALAAGAIFVANRLIGKKGVFEIKDII